MKKNEGLFLIFIILSIAICIIGWVKDIELPLIYAIAISFSYLASIFSKFGDSRKQLKEIKQINKEYSLNNPKLKDLVPGDIIEIQFGYSLQKATVLRNYPENKDIYLDLGFTQKMFSYETYSFRYYTFIKHKS